MGAGAFTAPPELTCCGEEGARKGYSGPSAFVLLDSFHLHSNLGVGIITPQ